MVTSELSFDRLGLRPPFPGATDHPPSLRPHQVLGGDGGVVAEETCPLCDVNISQTFPVFVTEINNKSFPAAGEHPGVPQLYSPVTTGRHQLTVGFGAQPDQAVHRLTVALS